MNEIYKPITGNYYQGFNCAVIFGLTTFHQKLIFQLVQRIFKKYLLIILAFLLGSIVSLITPIVFAHGGNINFIHACVKNSNGAVRIISASSTCGSGETSLDWVQNGIGAKGGYTTDQLTNYYSQSETLNYKDFSGFNFTGSQLHNPNIDYSSFIGANFTNALFATPDVTSSNFQNANFTGATINGYDIRTSDFTNANFTGADLSGGSSIVNDNFTGANFTNANLAGVDYTNSTRSSAIWSNTTCPDNTNSDNNGGTCEGHLTP